MQKKHTQVQLKGLNILVFSYFLKLRLRQSKCATSFILIKAVLLFYRICCISFILKQSYVGQTMLVALCLSKKCFCMTKRATTFIPIYLSSACVRQNVPLARYTPLKVELVCDKMCIKLFTY